MTVVFTATTGRSGTASLFHLLRHATNANVDHEPWPRCVNPVSRRDLDEKIRLTKRKEAKAGIYIETSHLFIPQYCDDIVTHFPDLKVIHLVRDPYLVARSFYRLGSIPGRTRRGKAFLIDPEEEGCLIPYYDQGDIWDDFRRCVWYTAEMWARIEAFKIRHPYVPFFKLKTAEISSFTRMENFLGKIGVKIEKPDSITIENKKRKVEVSKIPDKLAEEICSAEFSAASL